MPAPASTLRLPGLPDFGPQQPTYVDASFPQTGLLDDFNRADATPPANWTSPFFNGAGTIHIASNRLATDSTGSAAGIWNPQAFGPDCEAWAQIVVFPTAGIFMGVSLRTEWPFNSAGVGRYTLRVTPSTSQWVIRRTNPTLDLVTFNWSLTPGDWIGLRAVDDTLTAFYSHTGKAGDWVVVGSVVDTFAPLTNLIGYIGVESGVDASNGGRWDNFGGGSLSPVVVSTPPRPNALTDPLMPPTGLSLYPSQQPYYPPAVGTTFNQALTADAVLVTALLQKQINKQQTASNVVVTASAQKQVNKNVTASVPVTASIQKQVNKAVVATSVVVTATLVTLKTILKALAATAVVVTASIQKQVNKPLTATTVAVTASLQKQVNKTITATTVVVTATLQALKVILKALTANVSVTGTLQKQVNKPLVAATLAVTASVQKQINKRVTATTVAVTASLQALKVIVKVLTTTVVVTASTLRQVQTHLSATVTLSASITKRINKTLSATVNLSASLLTTFVGALVGPFAASLSITDQIQNVLGISDLSTVTAAITDAAKADVAVTDSGTSISVVDQTGPDVKVTDITP